MLGDVSELLEAWERGLGEPPVGRALTLLAAASGDDPGGLAALPLGERDRRLFALRERLFGPSLENVARCPACGETLEFACRTSDLVVAASGGEERTLEAAGYEVTYRLLASADFEGLGADEDAAAARLRIVRRCIVSAARDGEEQAGEALPARVLEAVAEALGRADSQADLRIDLSCACGASWEADFDIVGYLWSEVEAWAKRLLIEVHTLAARYHWSERDILAMSSWRRQTYLGLGET